MPDRTPESRAARWRLALVQIRDMDDGVVFACARAVAAAALGNTDCDYQTGTARPPEPA